MQKAAYLICFSLWCGLAQAQTLRAEPEIVEFHTQQDSALVAIYLDGRPYPADRMQGWRFMVDGHFYNHMVDVRAEGDHLRIRPTDRLEVGQYSLHVSTPAGEVVVLVKAPLGGHKSIVDRIAEMQGITHDAARQKLGLTSAIEDRRITFSVSPTYRLGQTVKLRTSGPEDRHCVWSVNGEIVLEGQNKRHFNRAFWVQGEYTLHYVETAGDAVVAQGEATLTVVEPPTIPMQAPAGRPVSIIGPEGYRNYRWIVDGQVISEERTFEYTFTKPGSYTLISQATDSVEEGKYDNAYRRYAVDAQRTHAKVQFGAPGE